MYQQMKDAVRAGNAKEVAALVQKAVDEKKPVAEIINEGLIGGMNIVGELFGNNQMFVPEVMMASRAMNAGMDIVKPLLSGTEIETKGTVVFATVKGDLHDIGKSLCKLMLEGAGYHVVDLGVDVAPEKITQTAKDEKADIVAMSAMLTTTMLAMKDTIDQLKEAGLGSIKVMVGGAPINDGFAEKIGGNYSKDAAEAVILANNLMGA